MAAPRAPHARAWPADWPGAATLIEAIARSLAGSASVILVLGTAAAGAGELVDAAVERAGAARLAGSIEEVAAALAIAVPRDPAGWLGWIQRVARAARRHGGAVVIELADDRRAGDVIGALARADGATPVIVRVDRDPGRAPGLGPRPGVAVHSVPALDQAGVAALADALIGAPPPRAWAHALYVATGGLARTVVELVRSTAGEPHPFAVDWTARTAGGLAELRARQLRGAPAGVRRVAAAIAAWGGRASVEHALATARADARGPGLAELAELERLGFAHRRADRVELDGAVAEAIEAVAGGDAIARLATAALPGVAADPARLAPLLERAVLDADRAGLACEAAEHLLACGRADRALGLAGRALRVLPARAGLVAAQAAALAGAHREAGAYARAAEAAGADPVRAGLFTARAAERAGERAAAEAVLAALHAAHPGHPEVAGRYAALLVARGRAREARAIATAGGPLDGERAEAAGLAALSLGELEAADAAFAALEIGAAATGDAATAGRAALLRGRVAHRRGQLGLASDRVRQAARRLAEVGELAAAATAERELGTLLIERGRASEALPRLVSAGRVLAELGATREACAAELGRGDALLLVGQLDEARVAAEAALSRAAGDPLLCALAWIGTADARRRLGDEAGALHGYREALALAAASGDGPAQLRARLALLELGEAGDGRALQALCASDDDRDRWTLARGRLALRDPASLAEPGAGALSEATRALARACGELAVRATEADRLERAFRGHAIAAQLAARARDGELARRQAERARIAHAALSAATAPAFRAAIDGDPDLARLPAAAPIAAPDPAHGEPHGSALRRLLALSRRLHSEPSVERLADEILDAAIELTCAERGFLLLRQPDGALAAVAARHFGPGELEPGAAGPAALCRALAERAAQAGEPQVTADERSVAPRLAPALAVPLRQRGDLLGSLYVDHRLRRGAFDAAAASVLGELADLAAIAIANAQRTAELRRAAGELEERTARLSRELAARDAELASLRAGVPAPGDDLQLRPVIAATEQGYIEAAMARARGNQTVAARLLGLSRFGLQKKLRRLAGEPGDDEPSRSG